jgi:hypothetical protein
MTRWAQDLIKKYKVRTPEYDVYVAQNRKEKEKKRTEQKRTEKNRHET